MNSKPVELMELIKRIIKYTLCIITATRNRVRHFRVSLNCKKIGKGSRLGARLILSGNHLQIGDHFSCNWDCRIVADNVPLDIGDYVVFGHHVDVAAGPHGYIKIGDRTSIAQFVVLRNCSHEYKDSNRPIQEQGHTSGTIDIGEDCIISTSCVILPNTQLGKGCVIGAGSILSGNYPDYSILMGNPARVIGTRK
jgi:virginiamycin A acetyltransferase